ncbi:hypothetical protein F2P56_030867 [Juglans regia]|uniref:Uncharacterized protein LOC109000868 n=2 Tax=Juglans regia TaxID=51240 RepID=A0A2I4FP42_JUGRE|nr:uncharacterized protein LOC109000868 [Juglans regia]KAF5450528.1 hypothetical protein F2P56_030867 [Juglans regia]
MMSFWPPGYESYGHGGSSASSSNLSALAPPFMVVPKPISSPLVDLTEPSYGVPLNSSLHNWLPSRYPNSGPGLFPNHDPEYDPVPSSDAYGYAASQYIGSLDSHLSPLSPVASAPIDTYLYVQRSDSVEASTVKAQQFYPTYVPPGIEDHSPLVVPDDNSYDWLSCSNVATWGGSSNNDHAQSGWDNTVDWVSSCNGLGEWEHDKQVEIDGSFCLKGSTMGDSSPIYKNDVNQGSHASEGLDTCAEASHIIDMLGLEKRGGCVSMEQTNDKSFSGKNSRIMSADYSKTSFLGSPSVLPENHYETPSVIPVTNIYKYQVPCSASNEKPIRHHDASLSGCASFVTSSHSLVIRPPDVNTSLSAPNKGPLVDMDFGTDAADPDLCGNSPSNVNKFHPLIGSESKVLFDTSQLSIHLDKNYPIGVESFSSKNEELSKKKEIPEDALDQVFKPKCGLQVSHTSSDGFNFALDFVEAINPVENSSESLDHYNPAVDSPCWKGVSVTCFSPFEASKTDSCQYFKKLESNNSSDFQVPQVFTLNIDDAVKVSSQNPNEKTVYVEKGLRPPPKRPSDANSLSREPRSDDSVNTGPFYSKSSCGYAVPYSGNDCEPGENHALFNMSTVESDLIPSLTTHQNFEATIMIPEKKHSSDTCVADSGSSIGDPARNGLSNVPFHNTGYGLSSASLVEDACAKLTKLHEADSTPNIDVQMLVSTMCNLSDLLLFHSLNDSLKLTQGDCKAIKDVIFNLHRCILKDGEKMIPTQESPFLQQGMAQHLEELAKRPKEVNVDRPGLTKDAPIIAQDQHDPKCLHDKKHHNIGSGNKMEMISDFVSVKGDASRLEKDNMTQAIMKVLNENFDYEEEMEPKCSLFKNLWLEAEAEVCSINYKARYNRMKIEMEKSELNKAKDASENTMDVEKTQKSKASCNLNTLNKLVPEANIGPSPDISIQDTPSMQHVRARYGILKHQINYSNSTTALEEASSSNVYPDLNKVDRLVPETTEAKCPKQDISNQNSPILGTTCHVNDVMSRFHILKCQVDLVNSIKATDLEEPLTESVSPDWNEIDNSEPEATEAKGTLIMDIPTQNPPILTRSCHSDDIEASVMARFLMLKCRDENLSFMDAEKQEPEEVIHLGLACEKNHRPITKDRSGDGIVDEKLEPVLQNPTANGTEDKLTVKDCHLPGNDPMIQFFQSNKPGDSLIEGWYDGTSLDWEHVMKEEL